MSKYVIENWCVTYRDNNPYLAPELRKQCLGGRATNVEDLDGLYTKNVITTSIVGKTKEGHVVTKSGSVYVLGNVLDDYESHYPGAKERLINTLPVIDTPK